MGNDLARALSRPFESAVHDCTQISSESDCSSGCCSCHTKTIAPEAETESEPEDQTETEINILSKENG